MSVVDTLSSAKSSGFSIQTLYYFLAIVGLLLTWTFHKDLGSWLSKVISKLKKQNEISNYFESKVPHSTEIDVLVYQFGLRATLPVIDWFYLEYINYLTSKVTIKKVVIFPTIDKSRSSQIESDLEIFSQNIKEILKNIDVEIISPYNDSYFDKEDLVSDEFISTLKYIGTSKYFEFLRREFLVDINSISDFNKYRSDDDKIKDIYTHIYKCWGVVNYIKRNYDLTKQLNVSALFWEWEADKIGVLKQFSNNNENVSLFPILGKTQMLNKNTPVPVFIEKETICIFDSNRTIIEIAIPFIPFISKYNVIIEAVLKNYQEIDKKQILKDGRHEWESYKTSYPNPENELVKGTKNLYVFLGLLLKIKSLIKNGNK